ncbi:MAG: hypothetical protein JWM68_1369 [Verrucomicrobiales bacterium]|nr:hypothetical protein [Verrucomicrobiales bacterium]
MAMKAKMPVNFVDTGSGYITRSESCGEDGNDYWAERMSPSIHQPVPWALQCILNTLYRCEQNIYVPSFDLLNGSNI